MSDEYVPPARRCTVCDREATASESPPLCPDHAAAVDADMTNDGPDGGRAAAVDAFGDVIRFYHKHVDDKIDDHTDGGDHPDRPVTAQSYFTDVRGWRDETVADRLLGWAPPDHTDRLIAYLYDRGHDREAILSTGVFHETDDGRLFALWEGRYVLPYFDADGRPVYAIARCTGSVGGGAAGYDGHPADGLSGKYAKVAHSDPQVPLSEPIYGADSLDDDTDTVVIAEGIADAISATEAGWGALSPVTTEFKREHIPPLAEIVQEHSVERVVVVPDAEPASFTRPEDADPDPDSIGDALDMPTVSPGRAGALRTADLLDGEVGDDGVDVRVAQLPAPASEKVDLDDYLTEWREPLAPVVRSATPAENVRGYEKATDHLGHGDADSAASSAASPPSDTVGGGSSTVDASDVPDDASALWALDVADVTPAGLDRAGDRGANPVAHKGTSENYFILRETDSGDLVAGDYKGAGQKAQYNALTLLLVSAGERHRDAPEGSLSDAEVFEAWREARTLTYTDDDDPPLPAGDPVPYRALVGLAVRDGVVDEADLVERGDDDDSYRTLPGTEAYNQTLAHIRNEYGLDPGRESVDDDTAGGGWGVETCTPPAVDRQSFDRREHWAHLQGERFDETLADDGPVVWADPAGSGKTTNAARAAADRDEPHYVSFQNHRKAREFQVDDATPDGYFHLRGGAQKRHDDCLDADHAGEECPKHDDTRDCPHMCPVYDLDSDHPTRQLYDAVKEALGPVEAHLVLAEALAAEAGHDDDGHCPWLNQFAEVASEERVVGVHEYLTLKTVRDPSDGPTRQVVVDEYAGAERVATDTELDVEKLTRAERFLDGVGATDTEREVFDALAALLREVRDGVADDSVDEPLAAADDPTDDLAEIGDSRRLYVNGPNADNVPDWATEVKAEKRDPDPGNDMARAKRERYYVETDGVGELLARAAVSYREAVRTRYEHDPEGAAGVPYAADAVLAVVAATADPARGGLVRKAMNAPTRASTCPRCGSDLVRVADDPADWSHIGGHDCEECGWNSDRHTYLGAVDRPARATAWVTSDTDGTDTGVTVRRLPDPDSLPDDPLLLDATARPDPVAGLFDVSVDDVAVYGDEPAAYDGLEVTQVVDGQYHPGTLKRSESARERVATTLRKLGSAHGDVLVVGPKRLYSMFSEALPEGAEWLSYHATRGLNRAQYDAIVCVGAPHPRVADLRRNAGLLAQGHDDLRRGGEEHSTRRDARPPVYRRLDYRDGDGDGRAVPTKHYTGLTGELFQQSREDELVQAVHRIRPLLAEGDETNHAYLLTNVPTPLPVDTLATFDELAEPLRAVLPVHDGALRLAEYVGEIEAGDDPDGFRATAFVEGDQWRVDELHRLAAANGETVGERQVRRWVNDLVEIGLLDAGSYEPRAGVPYEPADESTLTSALQVLRGDGGVEVALQRRFGQYLREAESLRDWLAWARRNLAVTGELERWVTGDSKGTPPG
jgi:hypothetical protein